MFYRYDVEMKPEQSKDKTRRLYALIFNESKFSSLTCATDYAKTVVTTKELDLNGTDWRFSLTVPPPPGGLVVAQQQQGPVPGFVQQARDRNKVQLRITRTGSFTPREMIQYLCSTASGAEYAGRGEMIQLLNIVMAKAPNSSTNVKNVKSAGGNKFYPFEGHPECEKADLRRGLQALRGYYSSVRPAVGRLLVNLNVTSGAFYKPIPLQLLLREFAGNNNDNSEVFIRMLRVKATYTKTGQKTPFMEKIKTIVGFAKPGNKSNVVRFGNATQVKFKYTDGSVPGAREQEVTIVDYFQKQHGIKLELPQLPVLNVGTRADPQYLPVELCTVLPGQVFNRILSGEQTTEMLRFAARAPNLNAESIAGTAAAVGRGLKLFRLRDSQGLPDPQISALAPFGFRVGVDMLTVPGRILPAPSLKYGGSKTARAMNGSWNLAGQRFITPGSFGQWQVIVFNADRPGASEEQFSNFERTLRDYGLRMGARMPTKRIALAPLISANRDANDRAVEKVFSDAVVIGVRFFLIILPEVDKWLYARIKLFGDVKYGIHSINCVGAKFAKEQGQDMYFGNLALKFNIKGGGVNHDVPNTLVKPLDNNTMLMGIDVTHPSPGSTEGAPSIACVVASTDHHLSHWPGSIRPQTGREEMVQGLEDMVIERLNLWQKKNGKLPGKIVLYRDGVSEGQYSLVLERELPPFYAAFTKKYGDKKKWPSLAVIIVGKRHHTRFYPTREADADYNAQKQRGSWNPKPGTVVDRHISGKILREFWMQAHQGLQGTARPAHYVVIKDDIKFEADELEQFTHNLCYLFNRATKAVSICPPAYYADLLCERGRCYLFSTLAESHGSDSGAYNAASAEWNGGVHERIKDSTWYI